MNFILVFIPQLQAFDLLTHNGRPPRMAPYLGPHDFSKLKCIFLKRELSSQYDLLIFWLQLDCILWIQFTLLSELWFPPEENCFIILFLDFTVSPFFVIIEVTPFPETPFNPKFLFLICLFYLLFVFKHLFYSFNRGRRLFGFHERSFFPSGGFLKLSDPFCAQFSHSHLSYNINYLYID